MSYEEDNEFANGANGRFDGLDRTIKAGGSTRKLPPDKADDIMAAMKAIGAFYSGSDLDPSLLTPGGFLKADLKTVDLLREFKAVKDLKEATDLLSKEAGRLYDFLRLVAVPQRFDEDGISNMKVDGVGRVQLAADVYAGIIKGKEEAAFEFLDDNGRGDVVKKTVNSSSLKAIIKAMTAKGEEFPTDVFKAEPFTRASIVKT